MYKKIFVLSVGFLLSGSIGAMQQVRTLIQYPCGTQRMFIIDPQMTVEALKNKILERYASLKDSKSFDLMLVHLLKGCSMLQDQDVIGAHDAFVRINKKGVPRLRVFVKPEIFDNDSHT